MHSMSGSTIWSVCMQVERIWSYRNVNVCIPGGWGFLFDVSTQIIFFGNLCEILFCHPNKNKTVLWYSQSLLYFSLVNLDVFLSHTSLCSCSQVCLNYCFFQTYCIRGQYLMEVLEFIRLVHCFCIESKIKSMVDPLAICLVSLASIK